jgi:ABC-type cobalamin/Fe3+-siderophores transport system ATPase subunit
VLPLDEPTSALDAASITALESLVAESIANGTSVVWSTHDNAQARRIGSMIFAMSPRWQDRGRSTVTYIQLAYSDLVLPALLVVMALSLVLGLMLEKQLAIATVRMVLQLVLVGYVLTFLFAAVSPLWTALAVFIMVPFKRAR